MERVEILGLNFDNFKLSEAAEYAVRRLESGEFTMIVTANAEFGRMAVKNKKFRELFNGADMLVADGAGVLLAAKILGKRIKEKAAGVELAGLLASLAAERGKKLYLLGGKPGIAELAAENLKMKNPLLDIAGMSDGYFEDEEAVRGKILRSDADIVFVCLGSPKQELFMRNSREMLAGRVMIGLGGTLDVFAGVSKRAPEIFIKLGLEWFYRLLKEPRRIGRMMKLPLYVMDAVLVRLKLKRV